MPGVSDVVLALHGTRSPAGQACARELAQAVERRTGRVTRVGFVDVVAPGLDEVAGPDSVVVPCFLGHGYHVRVDVARTVRDVGCRVTAGLSPEGEAPTAELVDAVLGRLDEVGGPGDGVVLGWAGSSDARSQAQVGEMAAALSQRCGVDVRPATPATTAQEVQRWRQEGACDVVVATYLLAPGVFADRLRAVPGARCSAPIGVHPALVELIAGRVAGT